MQHHVVSTPSAPLSSSMLMLGVNTENSSHTTEIKVSYAVETGASTTLSRTLSSEGKYAQLHFDVSSSIRFAVSLSRQIVLDKKKLEAYWLKGCLWLSPQGYLLLIDSVS